MLILNNLLSPGPAALKLPQTPFQFVCGVAPLRASPQPLASRRYICWLMESGGARTEAD